MRRYSSGQLRKILPGVFSPAALPDEPRLHVAAAAAWAPTAVFAGMTALWLWGLGPVPACLSMIGPTQLRSPVPWLDVRRVRGLDAYDIVQVGRYRATSTCRTLIDVGARIDPGRLEDIFDDAWRRGLVTPSRIAWHCSRKGGTRKNSALIRQMAKAREGQAPTDSRLEDRTVRLIRRWGLRQPNRQQVVSDGQGRRIGRMDLVYPEDRLIIECDSFGHHSDSRTFHHDRPRWSRLVTAGFRLQWATWENTRGDGRAFIDELKRNLGYGPHR